MKILPKQLIPLVAVIAIAAGGYFAFLRQDGAPEVKFMTVKGEAFRTSDLRGKVVLINFWATDCAPCMHEMPRLIET